MIFAGSGCDRRDRQADRHPRPAHPGRPRRPLPALPTQIPADAAPGRVHRPVRAPLQRAAVARVDRRRRDDPARTPTATSTSTRLRERARPVRRPAAEDRLVLGGVATSPASSPTPHGDLRAAARARRAVVLGLRRRGAVRRHRDVRRPRPATRWPTRTRSSSRPHKFIGGPGTPGRAGRPARAAAPTGCPTCPAAAPSPTSTRPSTATSTDPAHREEGGTPAIVESIRAGLVFQLKEAVGVEVDPGRTRSGCLRRAVDGVAGRAGDRDPRQPRRRAAVDRVVRGPRARAGATCTTTSSSRCSTTCSASSRAAAARAPGRTATGCSASTSSARTSSSARSPAAARASSPAGCGSTSTTSSPRRSFDYIVEAVRLVARDGWRLLRDYRFDPSPGCGATATGRSSRRCACTEVTYDDRGRCCATGVTTTGRRESRWPSTCARRRRCSRAAARGAGPARPPTSVSADFEHLRWFDLPASSVTG